jgi:hypothetical protein
MPPSVFGSSGDNVLITSGGYTFYVAADTVVFAGDTAAFQLIKLAYGPTGSASIVDSTNGLPVNVIAGGITANLVGFCGAIQGIVGGQPVTVDGTVYVAGVSSNPVYVQTGTGYKIEITGGVPLNKNKDAISVFGPNGNTWIYANLVTNAGAQLGVSANPMFVQISGATINATINPTIGVTNSASAPLFVCGVSGATAISATVGNTVGINDTNIVSAINANGVTLNAIYNALSVFGLVRPTSAASGVLSVTTSAQRITGTSGFTCAAGVNFKALGTNTDLIYLGNSGVGSSFGYQLEPGENVFFNVGNANIVWVAAKTGTQSLSYFAS